MGFIKKIFKKRKSIAERELDAYALGFKHAGEYSVDLLISRLRGVQITRHIDPKKKYKGSEVINIIEGILSEYDNSIIDVCRGVKNEWGA